MIHDHPFWFLLLTAGLVWYSTVTIYVAIKGAVDIQQMLRRLKEGQSSEAPHE